MTNWLGQTVQSFHLDNSSNICIEILHQEVMRPYKPSSMHENLYFEMLFTTLHTIKQFDTTKRFPHFQTTLAMMQMDTLNTGVVVTKTFIDGVVPGKVTDFCHEPPEQSFYQKKKEDSKFVFSIYAFPKIISFRHTMLRNS